MANIKKYTVKKDNADYDVLVQMGSPDIIAVFDTNGFKGKEEAEEIMRRYTGEEKVFSRQTKSGTYRIGVKKSIDVKKMSMDNSAEYIGSIIEKFIAILQEICVE